MKFMQVKDDLYIFYEWSYQRNHIKSAGLFPGSRVRVMAVLRSISRHNTRQLSRGVDVPVSDCSDVLRKSFHYFEEVFIIQSNFPFLTVPIWGFKGGCTQRTPSKISKTSLTIIFQRSLVVHRKYKIFLLFRLIKINFSLVSYQPFQFFFCLTSLAKF